jgi:hypothetical protein
LEEQLAAKPTRIMRQMRSGPVAQSQALLVASWPYLATLQGKVHPGIMAKRDFFCGFIFFQGAIFWISAQFEPTSGRQ